MVIMAGVVIESSWVYWLVFALAHHGSVGWCLYWVIMGLLVGVCIDSS